MEFSVNYSGRKRHGVRLTSLLLSSAIVLSSIVLSILEFNCPVSSHSFFQSVLANIDLWSAKKRANGIISFLVIKKMMID